MAILQLVLLLGWAASTAITPKSSSILPTMVLLLLLLALVVLLGHALIIPMHETLIRRFLGVIRLIRQSLAISTITMHPTTCRVRG